MLLPPLSEYRSEILKTKHTRYIHEIHCSDIQKRYQPTFTTSYNIINVA